jgi:hypothetical protein
MSPDDVSPNEMNAPHDFDDAAAEALLSGHGGEVDPRLAELLDNLCSAYTSNPPAGAELSALIGGTVAAPAALAPDSRRFERMRSSIMAKVGVALAAMFAATGSLAVANALPAPMQNVAAHLGVGAPAQNDETASPADEESTTTTEADEPTDPAEPTPTTVEPKDNHGSEVAAVAHDDSVSGCEHGAAVSKVASDGRSHNDGSCDDTSTTIPDGTPPADAKGHDGNETETEPPESGDHETDAHQKDGQDHETESGDSSDSGSSDSGSSDSGSSDSGSSGSD